MRLLNQFISILVILVLISSCKKDDLDNPVSEIIPDSIITEYLDSLGLSSARDESGFYFFPDTLTLNPNGASVSQAGQVLAIYYELSDLDGEIIASHQRADGDSLLFKYSSNATFPIGLDLGIELMRVGESFNFILPPSLAYENVSSISTTDGSGIVIMKVSLVAILSEDQVFLSEIDPIDEYIKRKNLNDTISITIDRIDTTFLNSTIVSIDTTFIYDIDSVVYFDSGIRYKQFVSGEGFTPVNGDQIVIDYSISYLDEINIDSKSNFTVTKGSGIPSDLVFGLDFGLSLMNSFEEGLIIIPSSQGYRESALIIPAFISSELIELDIIPDYVEQIDPYKTLLIEVVRKN
ncbi:MAG: FKBP-type peptidyl-prolyl cis-trans isomerase [Ekhidna sp.]